MYGKLFTSMYDGTLVTNGEWEGLVTFQQFIILSDEKGIVDMTLEAIHRRTGIPMEILQKGVHDLEKPDPQSRTPDEEGRRIVRLSDSRPWGWKIVNYQHYRAMRSAEDRREYMKNYQREYRKQNKPSVNSRKQNKPSAYASASSSSSNSSSENFEKFWNAYPARNGKKPEKEKTQKLFVALMEADQVLAITAAINFANSGLAKAGMGIKYPKRFLRDGEGEEPWRDWIEPEIPTTNGNHAGKMCWKRIEVDEQLKPCKEPVIGTVNGNHHCSKHPLPATNGAKP